MQVFTPDELSLIHDASMDILKEAGVKFIAGQALDIFRQHGFKTEDTRVFITEKDVGKALEKVPPRFTIYARNPAHNVSIGEDDFVFLPTGGAPNVVSLTGKQRPALLADYEACCKLAQTSDQLDMNGCLMVQPTDIAPQVAHLDMLLACGQLGSYISMSFKKWLLDEEVCGMIRRTLTAMEISTGIGRIRQPAQKEIF
jgi:trimethylamine--corrinoid protein Co-methyltransferase